MEIKENDTIYYCTLLHEDAVDNFSKVASIIEDQLNLTFHEKVGDWESAFWEFYYKETAFNLHYHGMMDTLEIFTSKAPESNKSLLIELAGLIKHEIKNLSSLNTTLLIPSKPDLERDSVANSWEENKGNVKRLDKFWIKPELETQNIAIYGNDTFSLVVAQVMGVELVSPKDEDIALVEHKWVKRNINIGTIDELNGLNYPCFIKPVVPKTFTSKIYNSHNSIAQSTKGLDSSELVIISSPITIECEVRSFILNNKLRDLSIYEGNGDLREAKKFIYSFLENTSGWPSTFVLDVGYNSKDGWFIIEFNSTWGAGLNGCSPDKVIPCIEAATINLQGKS